MGIQLNRGHFPNLSGTNPIALRNERRLVEIVVRPLSRLVDRDLMQARDELEFAERIDRSLQLFANSGVLRLNQLLDGVFHPMSSVQILKGGSNGSDCFLKQLTSRTHSGRLVTLVAPTGSWATFWEICEARLRPRWICGILEFNS